MRILATTFLIAVLLTTSLFGQSMLEPKQSGSSSDVIGTSRIDSKFSLLDLSRLEMRHSYSISFFSSDRGSSTIAMYMNSIRYRISKPLTLNINLAWMHQPGNLLFQDRGKPTDYGKILPSFTLEYHPSDKFHLEVGFHSIDPYMYHLYGRDGRWSPDEYWNYDVRKKQ